MPVGSQYVTNSQLLSRFRRSECQVLRKTACRAVASDAIRNEASLTGALERCTFNSSYLGRRHDGPAHQCDTNNG